MQPQRRMNSNFAGRGGQSGVVVKGGGVMMKDALVRALNTGSLALSGRGLTALPPEFTRLDTMEYDNKTWWQEFDVSKLDLSHNALTEVPDFTDLPMLGSLQSIVLLDNQIERLPDKFFRLPSLTNVNASSNKLSCVPDGVGSALNLQALDLSKNPSLQELPSSFGNLHHLSSLNLSDCGLVALPESFGGCSGLQVVDLSRNALVAVPACLVMLQKLTSLDVSKNRLASFPELPSSPSLTRVDLKQNCLTNIPDGVLSCPGLADLTLSFNRLTRFLSKEEAVVCLPSLVALDLRDNKIQDLSFAEGLPRLAHLNVSNNDITSLPPGLGFVETLQTLQLEGNSIRSVRREVLTKGTAEILKYLRSRAADDAVPAAEKTSGFESKAARANAQGLLDLSRTLPDPPLTEIPLDALAADNEYTPPVRVLKCNHQNLAELPGEISLVRSSLAAIEVTGGSWAGRGAFSVGRLDRLPATFAALANLRSVNFAKNAFSAFPAELLCLPQLAHLDLSLNRLTAIPPLRDALPQLDTLLLSENGIAQYPPSLPASLTVLALASNRISDLPAGLPAQLPRLATLDLSNNNVSAVPAELGTMPLRALALEGNPLKAIRRGVLEKGTVAVLAYLRDKMSTDAPPVGAPSGRRIVQY
ncbi:Plant intracellular Ras-group-related LRR protein 6 [Diplonema papillatum]|nr:Plant intracellular Ras-group-related LRR protein 6 [Diplonema papillatum]